MLITTFIAGARAQRSQTRTFSLSPASVPVAACADGANGHPPAASQGHADGGWPARSAHVERHRPHARRCTLRGVGKTLDGFEQGSDSGCGMAGRNQRHRRRAEPEAAAYRRAKSCADIVAGSDPRELSLKAGRGIGGALALSVTRSRSRRSCPVRHGSFRRRRECRIADR